MELELAFKKDEYTFKRHSRTSNHPSERSTCLSIKTICVEVYDANIKAILSNKFKTFIYPVFCFLIRWIIINSSFTLLLTIFIISFLIIAISNVDIQCSCRCGVHQFIFVIILRNNEVRDAEGLHVKGYCVIKTRLLLMFISFDLEIVGNGVSQLVRHIINIIRSYHTGRSFKLHRLILYITIL